MELIFTTTCWLIAIAILTFLIWYAFNNPLNFWKDRNVPYIEPPVPFLGNLSILLKGVHQFGLEYYNSFPNEKYCGTFTLWRPTLIVRDPELIETVLIKDFSSLYNRNSTVDIETNALSKHLVNYTDENWKLLRNKLSPTFTSGKLKGMHPQITACTESFVNYLSQFERTDAIEVKELCSRYSMDVVASCAFGLDLDIMNHPESRFLEIGKKTFAPNSFVRNFFLLQPFLAPIYKKLKLNIFSKSLTDFFVNAVNDTLAYREKNGVYRPDYLHLLSELKKRDDELVEKKELDPNDPVRFDGTSVVSNAFVFFAAGFETTANTISFMLYELALNHDVQDKLYKEVSETLAKHGGELTFDAVNDMSYLDQVLSETLRIHSPGVVLDRKITKDYQLPGSNFTLPAGMSVVVPVYGLHHDPLYFPEPKKFDPERFDPEKNSIVKGTYLPFGAGPRICIAARFAKIESKICAASIIRNYKLHKCNKTKVPIEYDTRSFLLVPRNGIWLSFEKRTHVE